MKITTSDNEIYCFDLVKALNRDRFLLSLFVPEPQRSSIIALYAFDAELRHVHSAVTEELNAHIRYAWWQETLDDIKNGKTPRAHPVIYALANLIGQGLVTHASLITLVENYRGVYPDKPSDLKFLDDIAFNLLQATRPETCAAWSKAKLAIAAHREKYGNRMNNWLLIKLYLL